MRWPANKCCFQNVDTVDHNLRTMVVFFLISGFLPFWQRCVLWITPILTTMCSSLISEALWSNNKHEMWFRTREFICRFNGIGKFWVICEDFAFPIILQQQGIINILCVCRWIFFGFFVCFFGGGGGVVQLNLAWANIGKRIGNKKLSNIKC